MSVTGLVVVSSNLQAWASRSRRTMSLKVWPLETLKKRENAEGDMPITSAATESLTSPLRLSKM